MLADSGEDDIAFSDSSNYAANVELAEALAPPVQAADKPETLKTLNKVATPNAKTITEIAAQLKIEPSDTLKTLIVKADPATCESPFVGLVVRGDHQLNAVKAEKLDWVLAPLEMAGEQDIEQQLHCTAGSIGPVELGMPIIADRTAAVQTNFVCGANKEGWHLTGVNWQRDTSPDQIADIRSVVAGDASTVGEHAPGTVVARPSEAQLAAFRADIRAGIVAESDVAALGLMPSREGGPGDGATPGAAVHHTLLATSNASAINASISSGSRGALDSSSYPVSVTSTSSSTLTPMPSSAR